MNDGGFEHVVTGAPEPIEAEAVDSTPVAEEEQKAEVVASESSTDTVDEVEAETPADDGVQKRIDKLTKKLKAAERNAEYWRNQEANKQPEKPVEAPKLEAKTLEDFEYDETAYQQHIFAQAREGAVEAAKSELKSDRDSESAATRMSEFNSRVDAFADTVDDFDEVVRDKSLKISQSMVDSAAEMEIGPQVLYHLGKNPEIAANIAGLSPLAVGREMGRIEARLESQAKETKKVSEAPAPTPKISAGSPAVTKNLDELSGKAYNEARRKYINSHR